MSSGSLISTAQMIRDMRIRGASKIARAAAEAMAEEARSVGAQSPEEFLQLMRAGAAHLLSTRPTAVSLPNVLSYIMGPLEETGAAGRGIEEMRAIVLERSRGFVENSLKATEAIGKLGAQLLGASATVMTHCHSMAVVSIISEALKQGKVITAFVKETRPLYQGYMTAKMLADLGIGVHLIVDSAAAHYMDRVDAVLIGADAIALDGSIVNKVGTRMTAIAAKDEDKPVYVAAETYKIALRSDSGERIPIEMRDPLEVVSEEFTRQNPGIRVLNPSFDVTDPGLVSKITTEVEVLERPFSSGIRRLISNLGYRTER
jgi:ribose 1,5-bisphosphate isomerase